MITQQGALNTTALVVPDLYVQIVAPQNLVINGVPSNVIGMVGTAQWGPVNTPVVVGTMAQYAQTFGSVQNRKYDMGTAMAAAVQQGAQSFQCVRVTDGTDAAATGTLGTMFLTFTSIYTGTLGNTCTVTWAAGSKASSYAVTIAMPGFPAEVFNNIVGTGNAVAVAMAAAINGGQGPLRPPSKLVTVTAGAGTTIPTAGASATLTGGADGVTTLTASVLVGSATTYTGMYALSNVGCSIGVLADADDSTQWSTIDAFGLAQGMYMIQVIPQGTSIATAVSAKASAGLDSYSSKLLHGDWVYWQDQTNNVLRLISPQGFIAGKLGNMSPEQSSLNKPLYSVVSTQKVGVPGTGQANVYSSAQLQTLFQAGIDVITNPGAGGQAIWCARLGHNSSSNAATSGDNYTRMTNYIAATLNAGMGKYIGQVINLGLLSRIRSTLLTFFSTMLQQGQLGLNISDGSLPYGAICDATNNPQSRTSLGYVQADCQVQYMGINEKFIVNIEGGTTVQVTKQTTPAGQIAA